MDKKQKSKVGIIYRIFIPDNFLNGLNFDNFERIYPFHYPYMKFIVSSVFCFILFLNGYSQLNHYEFVENQGQWDQPYKFKSSIPGGELFLEKDKLVYSFWDQQKKFEILEAMHHHEETILPYNGKVNAHGIYVQFYQSNPNVAIKSFDSLPYYHNYFQSDNQSNWKSNVPLYKKIRYENLYSGIDLEFYTYEQNLKYDFIIHPESDPSQIVLKYQGAENIRVIDGSIHIQTSVNEWIEQKPYAYQLVDGFKQEVECSYRLKKGMVSFNLGKYNTKLPLIIDPTLIFSTYSGSTKDNWGFTATYDGNGNMYGGGIVFGDNTYPGNPGSFQLNYGGGQYDVLICKFNSTGNNLMYYTYLGGNQGEAPFSLVCNNQNQLYILGVTGSSGFPTTPGAYQTVFKGGPSASIFALNTIDYPNGSDIFVSKFSEDGTILLGSTFIGGTSNDGINSNNALTHNYADEFRGEIIVDNNDQCYIVSSTTSNNFPLINAAQGSLSGSQDAVVCKFNPGLTNIIFSTYLGGSGAEAGYSIQFNATGETYVTGGTTSSNFPTTGGVIKPNFGGTVDGFLVRYNSTGNAVLNATYLGTPSYDQCYAVQLDANNDVYVVGQTTGIYPITPGVYSNPNSGQFIHKLNPSLSTTIFSTVFGRGIPGQIDIVPTAFLVDVCDHIYVAGWGGQVNSGFGGGNTNNLPITPNAHQTSTDGSDFYLIVLDDNATGLLYGTYFGGATSNEHVDGGTSRFDKNGIVYEAVCAGCGGNDDFPTTPGAWSNTNNSTNCNLGVFKFDVSDFTAILEPLSATTICVNGSVTLNNASTGGFPHEWDFGDGTFSTQQQVSHTYTQPGTYIVYLTVTAPNACITSDKDSIVVEVIAPPVAEIQPVPPLCPGTTVQLQASGGTTYSWESSPFLSNMTIPNPIASPTTTTDFYLTVTNQCGSDLDTITVTVVNFQISISENDTICNGSSTTLNATGGTTYLWNPSGSLNNPNISSPVANPNTTTTYTVTVTDVNGCILTETVSIQVDNFPIANAGNDQVICEGESIQLIGSGGWYFNWQPPVYLSNSNVFNPVSTPSQSITYILSASNTCGTDRDTVNIQVIRVNASGSPDTIICPGTSVTLFAAGGSTYLWSPEEYLNSTTNDTVIASPETPTEFIVIVTDTNGCSINDTIFVDLFPSQIINLGPNVLIPFGGSHQLIANGNGTYSWSPDTFLTCSSCPNPIATPEYSVQYTLTVTDLNGCEFYDSVWVFVEGSIYVPNTFTPNRDGINDIFFAYGVDIATFEIRIFNRWGQEIFVSDDMNYGWDGSYQDEPCQLGVYVYKINYVEVSGKEGQLIGHVNLIR